MKSSLFYVCKKEIRNNKFMSMLLLLLIAGSIGFALIPPLVLETIVNKMVSEKMVLLSGAFLYFGMLAISGIFDAGKEVMITVFGQKITRGMRHEMCDKLSRLPAQYFVKNEPGKITSRFVNDGDTLESLFTNGIISMLTDICKVVSIILVIFTKSKGLGLMLLVVTPLLFAMTRIFQKRMQAAQLKNRIAIEKVNNHVPETISNIRMIHSFYKEAYMEKKYDTYIEESYDAVEKSNFYDSIYSPIIVFISAAVIGVMMVLSAMGGGIQTFFGMSVGTAVAVIAYVGKVFDPLESIGMEIQNIQSAIAGIRRIDEFLKEPEKTEEDDSITYEQMLTTDPSKVNVPVISMENVTFGYDIHTPILKELNLQIEQGESVVLIGRTGAGKSTIFRLLLGLYEPNQGKVSIYGLQAGKIPKAVRRKLFGYVEQSFEMVDGSIAEQISLSDDTISMEQIEKAVRLVGLHDYIISLEDGYDTVAHTGLFSNGQLQLLSIARAIVCNPALLLLDEITANLDSETEQRVMEALKQASKNRTVVSISHRLYEKGVGTRVVSLDHENEMQHLSGHLTSK